MNVFDIGIILVILMFGVVGFKRGIIKEGASLIGVIVTFVLAYMLKNPVGNFLCKVLPLIDFGNSMEGMSALSILAYQLIAFLIMFVLILAIVGVFMSLSKALQKIVNLTIVLIIPSKVGGAIIGMISGYLIMFIVLINLNMFLQSSPIFTNSLVASTIINKTPVLSDTCKDYATTVYDIYQLGNDISEDAISKEEANAQAIDKMLKTKMVSKDLINDLIAQGKVKKSSYLQNVLNKY